MSPHRHTVLLVDDDDDTREVLELTLRTTGFVVTTAKGGSEALTMLRADASPCLLLLDLHMLDMSADTFRAEQLADPALARVSVVLVSGDSDLAERARELGVQGYVAKPIDVAELRQAIERHCANA